MKRNAFILIALVVVIALMIFEGARVSSHQPRTSETASAASGQGGVLKPGALAPDFELKTLEGKNVKLSDYRGKAVLLNFWATWCEPCKLEMPWIVDLNKKYGPQGLVTLGVAMDDSSEADIAKFAKDMNVNYPILLGKESVGDEYGGMEFLPTTFYIGRDGKIVKSNFGIKGADDIESYIKLALATPAPAGAQEAAVPQTSPPAPAAKSK